MKDDEVSGPTDMACVNDTPSLAKASRFGVLGPRRPIKLRWSALRQSMVIRRRLRFSILETRTVVALNEPYSADSATC